MSKVTHASMTKSGFFLIIGSLVVMAALPSHAAVAYYKLDNVVLSDGMLMAGRFSWTFDVGDFENGAGQFSSLYVPHTSHDHTDLEATIDVGQSIEITFPGNFHDDGVDISLFLLQPLQLDTSSSIDLVRSKYEIGGNGFHDGTFVSGSVLPLTDADDDGVTDDVDNCTLHANASQRDTDSDGYGNRCDGDFDNNCIVNPVDLGIFRSAFFSSDADADLDGDGVVNPVDLGLFKSLFFLPPGPGGEATPCEP